MKRLSTETKLYRKARFRSQIAKQRLRKSRSNNDSRKKRREILKAMQFFSNVKIKLPKTVGIGSKTTRHQLTEKIRKIKASINSAKTSSVTLDFSETEELHSCGTLLLVSELERILETPSLGAKLKATYPENKVVEQLFQHIGLLEKLGLPPRVKHIDSSTVTPWLYVSGTEGDLDAIAEKLPTILTEGENMELKLALLSGMAEAIANSSEHAYSKNIATEEALDDSTKSKWWLFARQIDDDAVIAICDLGVGIPATIEKNWNKEFLNFIKTRIGMKREDHRLIQLALKLGETSTDDSHRGKGLGDILKVVKEYRIGSLGIYSNKGIYTVTNDDRHDDYSGDDDHSIFGTIIQWKVPLEALGLISGERNG